jgi:hypothetical protein
MNYKLFCHRVCLLIFVFTTKGVNAQVNESDTAKFQFRAGFTGNYQQGNVDVLTIKSRVDFSYAPVKHVVFKSQNSSLYQSFYAKKADNDIYSRNYFYYNPQHVVYPFGIAYISTNYRRQVGTRFFGGAGVTVQLLNKPLQVIKVSASSVYETTSFSSNKFNYQRYNGNNKIELWRATLYLGGWHYAANRHIRIYYDAYWQPACNDRHNFRTQFDVGADMPLFKGIAFNVLYSFTHENITVLNIRQDDKILTFGFSCNFKIKHS